MSPTPIPPDRAAQDRESLFQSEVLRLLHGGLASSLGANTLLAILLVIVQWQVIDHALAVAWLALLALVLAARALLHRGYLRRPPGDAAAQLKSLKAFRLGALATGATWGVHGLFLFPAGELAHQAILAFVLAGISAGAVTSLGADRPSALGFVVAAAAPFVGNLLLAGGTIPLTMGGMVGLFLLFIAGSTARLQHQFHENIRLRNESALQEATLRRQRQLGQAVERAQSEFIREPDRRKAFEGMLADILALTESEYGFIGEVLRTPQGEPYLKTYAITNIAWNEATRAFYDANAPQGMEFHNLKTLFGAALTSGRAVIANDPGHDPRRGGLPEGHPALDAFLGLPVHHGDALVAMIGVSNRPGGYDEALVAFLHPLLVTLGQLVSAERIQRQHRESEKALNQFKNTLDRTLDCVFMFDSTDLRFFYVNEGAVRQVGYSRDELLALHPFDIEPAFSEAQFREMVAPLIGGEKDSLTFETEHRHKNGDRVPVEIFLQYIAPADEPSRFVAIIRDITERKRVERMKSEFVSTVSHELRTPLTSISGALGLISGGALGALPEKAGELIAIAHHNSQRLALLINDLLDMEKLAAGKMRFDLQIQPLMPLVERALEANHAYGAERGVTMGLTETVPDGMVAVDGERLLQVLSNLLSNAVKFSPEGGEVKVAVTARDASVLVTVSDHGPGVPAAFHDRIFEKFAQADASDTRQAGGTGLGLAITRELVELMGGRIGFESVENEGASFFFELPLVSGNAATVPVQ